MMLPWCLVLGIVIAGCASRDGAHSGARDEAAATTDGARLDATAAPSDTSTASDAAAADSVASDTRVSIERAYDLDRDGRRETDLRVASCHAAATSTCLHALSDDPRLDEREWIVGPGTLTAVGAPHAIGPHFAERSPFDAIAVAYHDSALRAQVVVFDLAPGTTSGRAWVGAPVGWTVHNAWFAIARGPGGLRYPFLAPGQGYIPERTPGLSDWGFLCFFDPSRIAARDPACGTGFRSASVRYPRTTVRGGLTVNSDATFRHNGGWLDDLDGDGWDDVHLPYLWVIHTVSGRTGAPLVSSAWDVAAASEPAAPLGFHSGRHYGSFTTFRQADGTPALLIAAGNAVGTFADYLCNVSRFHAVAAWTPGAPSTRALRWANYHSFVKSIFRSPYGPAPVVDRRGDMMHRCVHRFGDGVFAAGTSPVTLYNWFDARPPARDCVAEQYQEVRTNFDATAVRAYSLCAETNFLPTTGRWNLQMLRLDNGGGANVWTDAYAWGSTTQLVPGGQRVFLVETLPRAGVRFDRAGHSPGALSVVAIGPDFRWNVLGSFPLAGVPRIRAATPVEGATGASWGGLPELVTQDRDGDGLDEVELADGRWIGWSGTGFVARP